MIIRARKELEFQLVLWPTNSHISLTWRHFLLILVNDLVRRWLAILAHWAGELYSYLRSKKIYLSQTARRDLSRALSIERQFAFPRQNTCKSRRKYVPCSKMLKPGRRRAEAIKACLTLAGFTAFPRCWTALWTTWKKTPFCIKNDFTLVKVMPTEKFRGFFAFLQGNNYVKMFLLCPSSNLYNGVYHFPCLNAVYCHRVCPP